MAISRSDARQTLQNLRAKSRASKAQMAFYGTGAVAAIAGGFLRARGTIPATILGVDSDIALGGVAALVGLSGRGGALSNAIGAAGLVRLGVGLDKVGASLAV